MIKQRYEQDCFLCCIAMAIGQPYDQCIEKWGREFVDRISVRGLVGGASIDHAFESVGLHRNVDYICVYCQLPGQVQEYQAAEFKKMLWGRRACIQVKSLNYSDRHHIVFWDGAALHDPSNLKTFTAFDELEPIYVWLFREGSQEIVGS